MQLFGSGDHVTKPDGSVIASYVHHLHPYTRKAREAPRRNIVELGKAFVRVSASKHHTWNEFPKRKMHSYAHQGTAGFSVVGRQ